jgi:hypothetical protein
MSDVVGTGTVAFGRGEDVARNVGLKSSMAIRW